MRRQSAVYTWEALRRPRLYCLKHWTRFALNKVCTDYTAFAAMGPLNLVKFVFYFHFFWWCIWCNRVTLIFYSIVVGCKRSRNSCQCNCMQPPPLGNHHQDPSGMKCNWKTYMQFLLLFCYSLCDCVCLLLWIWTYLVNAQQIDLVVLEILPLSQNKSTSIINF